MGVWRVPDLLIKYRRTVRYDMVRTKSASYNRQELTMVDKDGLQTDTRIAIL